MTAGSRRCAVIGSPIAHSLSPALHRAAYAHLGLDWTYDRHEVTTATLDDFMAALDDAWRGLSCTRPLKAAVVAWGRPDPTVAALGVANTVVFDARPGDRAHTRVANTDVSGLMALLRPHATRSALVLGTGATASSTVYALARLGLPQVQLAGRDPAARSALAARARAWGTTVVPRDLDGRWDDAEVVVSTIPAAAAELVSVVAADTAPVVLDVVYDPWPTPLAQAGRAAGRLVLSGRDLLVAQAEGQIALMTGQTCPQAVLRAALP
ncbi:MAG: shikimate dehydrogenase [Propionibacteriaceae bacterium]|jgi:shikimate dehydrogenase|nr:shikimate dehydrogenase [Propionibacteriaceae bacterium]